MNGFTGFPKDCPHFLFELGLNNNKGWFEENRARYQASVQEPLKRMASTLGPVLTEIDPEMVTDVRRVVSRIHRDIRFSKDKSPYRSNMWLGWKREWENWAVEPAFFFEIHPEWYRYGMGFYNIPKETMDRIRTRILARDPGFMRMVALAQSLPEFRLEGDKYKRIMKPELPEELQDWYQRKELFFCANCKMDQSVYDGSVADTVALGFRNLRPFYEWFVSLREEDRREG